MAASVAILLSCCSQMPVKHTPPPCPEYKSSICPYGSRDFLDQKRNCLTRRCTETPEHVPYRPAVDAGPVVAQTRCDFGQSAADGATNAQLSCPEWPRPPEAPNRLPSPE